MKPASTTVCLINFTYNFTFDIQCPLEMPIFPLIAEGLLTSRLLTSRSCNSLLREVPGIYRLLSACKWAATCHGEELSADGNALTLNSLIITLHFSVNFVKILGCFQNCSVLRRQFYFCKFPVSREAAL